MDEEERMIQEAIEMSKREEEERQMKENKEVEMKLDDALKDEQKMQALKDE